MQWAYLFKWRRYLMWSWWQLASLILHKYGSVVTHCFSEIFRMRTRSKRVRKYHEHYRKQQREIWVFGLISDFASCPKCLRAGRGIWRSNVYESCGASVQARDLTIHFSWAYSTSFWFVLHSKSALEVISSRHWYGRAEKDLLDCCIHTHPGAKLCENNFQSTHIRTFVERF